MLEQCLRKEPIPPLRAAGRWPRWALTRNASTAAEEYHRISCSSSGLRGSKDGPHARLRHDADKKESSTDAETRMKSVKARVDDHARQRAGRLPISC